MNTIEGMMAKVSLLNSNHLDTLENKMSSLLHKLDSINAMEVADIEGTYRRTFESVISVLKKNKDSLMAVLEAFVYEPLFNCRLVDDTAPKGKRSDSQGIIASGSRTYRKYGLICFSFTKERYAFLNTKWS